MAKSRVKKRRRGCLGGCLVNIVLSLGLIALLFVIGCYFGAISIDETTGEPQLSMNGITVPLGSLADIPLPKIDLKNLNLPEIDLENLDIEHLDLTKVVGQSGWAYGIEKDGLTVKTLRAGAGEAVLVSCDGYTMLLGAGDNGLLTCAQLLLCGAKNLSVVTAMSLESGQAGGMGAVIQMTKPTYLLYPGSQTKNAHYNAMMNAAQNVGTTVMAAQQGTTFSLGRATVRVIGPAYRNHTDERDDGLSVRVEYGNTSVLIMGTITQAGERELISSGAPLNADVLICSNGGSEEATSNVLATIVTPKAALMTGDAANAVKVRLQRLGCDVYTAEDHGVMTVHSDGQTVFVTP